MKITINIKIDKEKDQNKNRNIKKMSKWANKKIAKRKSKNKQHKLMTNNIIQSDLINRSMLFYFCEINKNKKVWYKYHKECQNHIFFKQIFNK